MCMQTQQLTLHLPVGSWNRSSKIDSECMNMQHESCPASLLLSALLCLTLPWSAPPIPSVQNTSCGWHKTDQQQVNLVMIKSNMTPCPQANNSNCVCQKHSSSLFDLIFLCFVRLLHNCSDLVWSQFDRDHANLIQAHQVEEHFIKDWLLHFHLVFSLNQKMRMSCLFNSFVFTSNCEF